MEINEKKLENILKEQLDVRVEHFDSQIQKQREEYQRYVGVLIEHFDSNVEVVAEQYTGLNKKVDGIVEMVGSMQENIETIKMDIAFIKNDLKKKVDRDEFAVLERRVALLEARG